MSDTEVDTNTKQSVFTPSWVSWSRYSEAMLRNIEKKILQYVKTAYRGFFVDIGPLVGPADKIWTISMNTDSTKTPLVMLHGLGSGVALWCLNLDSLAHNRPVYAFDLLGFGRSSRPKFNHDGLEAEQQMVKAVEEWRKEMKLERFVLLGHSMGGFLATSYAISHPGRVNHLILADPWGFPEKPPDSVKKELPFWVKAIAYALQPLNPLWAVRAAGPLGQWLIDFARPDLSKKFSTILKDEGLVAQYLYQCNAQSPSGESAFHSMMSGFGWAKHPMVKRIDQLHKDVPVTLIYGSKSWVDNSAGQIIKSQRIDSYVKVHVLSAGHHVYADKPEQFSMCVNEACELADTNPSKHLSILAKIPDSILDSEESESEEIKEKSAYKPEKRPSEKTFTPNTNNNLS